MQISELYKIYRQFPKVNTDTRKDLTGSIFFCLKGPNFDANTFADQALIKGAAHVVTDSEDNRNKANMTFVPDVLHALQELATMHRGNFSFPVIGLTGSNGKTTNKELIAAVLETHYKTCFTKGNLNNHIGVPLTILEIPLDAEIAVGDGIGRYRHRIRFVLSHHGRRCDCGGIDVRRHARRGCGSLEVRPEAIRETGDEDHP